MKQTLRKKLSLLLAAGLALAQIGISACGSNGALIAALGGPAPNGDYGDAPDNLPSQYSSGVTAHFPTRYSSNGAHHLDVTDSALGGFKTDGSLSLSPESDATDPADPDGVQNVDQPTGSCDMDHFDDGLLTTTFAPGVTNNLSFVVSVAPTAPMQTRYVNALIDWNHDGVWSGTDLNGAYEHVVKNMPVDVVPGTTKTFTSPDFLAGLSNDAGWLRITLTPDPIDLSVYPNGWDGTGEFKNGETEDYFLTDSTLWPLPDKKGGGGKGPPPPPPPPPGGGGGGGGNPPACDFYLSRTVTLCKGQTRNFLATVGGFAPDSVTATSSNPGVAGVTVNEANVTISGDAEGASTIDVTVVADGCTYHLTINVKVKKCDPKPKIPCCTPAEIAKDPSRCKNCHVVGWKIYDNETPAGGGSSLDGSIEETGSYGETDPNLPTKSTVVMVGNTIKVVVTFYRCDPCPEELVCVDPKEDVDCDGIPNEQDPYPENAFNPDHPQSYEEQLAVDSFFDVFFDVNNDHGIYDKKYFEPQETQTPTSQTTLSNAPTLQVQTEVGPIQIIQ